MQLVLKLIAGILAGVLIGLYGPEFIVRLALTAETIIGQLIKFTIPLIILFFITSGIASLPKGSESVLGKTIGLAYGSTIVAGLVAYGLVSGLLPRWVSGAQISSTSVEPELGSFIDIAIPAPLEVMTALVLSFVMGVGISSTGGEVLRKGFVEAKLVIELLLSKVLIPALPIYIAGVFTQMTVAGTVLATLKRFALVLAMAISIHWLWIIVIYGFSALFLGRSTPALLRNMIPAYLTALGTMSSAATIPVSLRSTKANSVSEEIADFTIPLCASIHLSGSTITIVTCAMAVLYLSPDLPQPDLGGMVAFILVLGVTMIAAPGAPGGAVLSALGLLTSMLGFNEAAIALMIALYLAQDSFGTACNVTGDGAIALWVDHFSIEARGESAG